MMPENTNTNNVEPMNIIENEQENEHQTETSGENSSASEDDSSGTPIQSPSSERAPLFQVMLLQLNQNMENIIKTHGEKKEFMDCKKIIDNMMKIPITSSLFSSSSNVNDIELVTSPSSAFNRDSIAYNSNLQTNDFNLSSNPNSLIQNNMFSIDQSQHNQNNQQQSPSLSSELFEPLNKRAKRIHNFNNGDVLLRGSTSSNSDDSDSSSQNTPKLSEMISNASISSSSPSTSPSLFNQINSATLVSIPSVKPSVQSQQQQQLGSISTSGSGPVSVSASTSIPSSIVSTNLSLSGNVMSDLSSTPPFPLISPQYNHTHTQMTPTLISYNTNLFPNDPNFRPNSSINMTTASSTPTPSLIVTTKPNIIINSNLKPNKSLINSNINSNSNHNGNKFIVSPHKPNSSTIIKKSKSELDNSNINNAPTDMNNNNDPNKKNIQTPARDLRKNKTRKQRAKASPVSADLFCRSCGETQTCEWRRGPDGYKSLCNACGIHYAKIVKKEESATANYQPKGSLKLNSILN